MGSLPGRQGRGSYEGLFLFLQGYRKLIPNEEERHGVAGVSTPPPSPLPRGNLPRNLGQQNPDRRILERWRTREIPELNREEFSAEAHTTLEGEAARGGGTTISPSRTPLPPPVLCAHAPVTPAPGHERPRLCDPASGVMEWPCRFHDSGVPLSVATSGLAVPMALLHEIKGLWLAGDPELSILMAGEGASVSLRLKMVEGLLPSPRGKSRACVQSWGKALA